MAGQPPREYRAAIPAVLRTARSVDGPLGRPHTGEVLSVKSLRERLAELQWGDVDVDLAIDSDRRLIGVLDTEIARIEKRIRQAVKPRPTAKRLQTVRGIGELLAQTIDLEVGDVGRFKKVGCFASYARCVKSERRSNGKKKGENNRRCGNRYLSWEQPAHRDHRDQCGAQRPSFKV